MQIDIDGKMLGIRYPMDVHLEGDSKMTLKALIPLLEKKTDRSWRESVENETAKWWRTIESRAEKTASPC